MNFPLHVMNIYDIIRGPFTVRVSKLRVSLVLSRCENLLNTQIRLKLTILFIVVTIFLVDIEQGMFITYEYKRELLNYIRNSQNQR